MYQEGILVLCLKKLHSFEASDFEALVPRSVRIGQELFQQY